MASRRDMRNGDEVAETVRRATSRTALDARSVAGELATALQHSAAEIGERTAEFGKRAVERARGAAANAQKTVREHPIAWLAAAAGAGTIIGLFLARRH